MRVEKLSLANFRGFEQIEAQRQHGSLPRC